MSTTDDAALVAELRRLNGGLDAEWGDDEAFDTLKTKLWLHRTRLLDLAEEAIRLRDVPHAKCINLLEEQHVVNESLRAEVEKLREVGQEIRRAYHHWLEHGSPDAGHLMASLHDWFTALDAAKEKP